jgi:hypothetical protein
LVCISAIFLVISAVLVCISAIFLVISAIPHFISQNDTYIGQFHFL